MLLALLVSLASATAGQMDAVALLQQGQRTCAGAWIDDERLVTAYHCVAGGRVVRVQTRDGARTRGRVQAVDRRRDLAIVGVAADVEPLALASESPTRGAPVRVLGHPRGGRAPVGYLAGTLRWSEMEGRISVVGQDALQISAPLNPGASGGPVLDAQGELVGVVSRRLDGQGLGFATRVERVRELLDEPQPMGPLGGTVEAGVLGSWRLEPPDALAVGAWVRVDFRDRVFLEASWARPPALARQLATVGEVGWVGAEGQVGLQQRLTHGPWAAHLGAYGGVAHLEARPRSGPGFRGVRPLVGVRGGLGAYRLDLGWVHGEEGFAARLRLGVAWPGVVAVF